MKISVPAIVAASLTQMALLSMPGKAQNNQGLFRTRTDVVSVSVSVQNGRLPVTGLRADDFVLLDRGVPQAVELVSLERTSLDLSLVLTARSEIVQFGPTPTHTGMDGQVRGLSSLGLVRSALDVRDRLRVVFVSCEVFSDLFDPTLPIPLARFLTPPWGPPCNVRLRLADGIFYALAWPVPPGRRHLVVVFSDGWDTGSALEIAALPELASRSDAVMYAVLWAPPGSTRTYIEQRRNVTSDPALTQAVAQTGGRVLEVEDADRTLVSILAQFRASYLLQFTPRGVSLPGWHDLTVSVRGRPNYAVLARRGYEGH